LPGELNVILVVLDDLGTDKLSMYGADVGPPVHCASAQESSVPTPNLDQLRAEGVLFTRCYSNPTCSPTRGALLTGRYAMRTGMGYAIYPSDDPGYTLPAGETLLPELLRDANPHPYRRAAFGKWHLTDYDSNDCNPADNGFELFQGVHGNPASHFNWRKVTSYGGTAAGCTSTISEDVRDPAGSPPSIAAWDAAVTRADAGAWIHGLDPSERFFAYVCFNPPHAPFQVPPLSTLSPATCAALGALNYEAGDTAAAGNQADERLIYHANIEAIDHQLGRLLNNIPADVMARTMVVVIGDNGTVGPMISDPTLAGHGKRSLYELGTRVPLIVKGPLVGANAGGTCRSLVGAVDVWRTVAGMTGLRDADVDAAMAGTPVDSQSFLDAILDPSRPLARTICYSEEFVNGGVPPAVPEWKRGITDGTWRYKRIDYGPDVRLEDLFHTAADPCELQDLVSPTHVLTDEESAALAALRAAMDAIQ
jgi:arylsulfatase A-like enzyme